MTRWIIRTVVAVAAIAIWRSLVFVDESETAIVTLFGDPVRTVEEAGLTWKLPYQSTIRVDRRLQVYDPRPSEFLTREKKNVDLDVFVCWRVDQPQRFLQTVIDFTGAESRIHDVVFSELAAEVGSRPLEALVYAPRDSRGDDGGAAEPAPGPEEVQRLGEIVQTVADRCAEQARTEYGIEIVDVQIKRISLPAQNRESVSDRMRSERARIAKQYRAEGEQRALIIRSEADRDRTKILADAGAEAEKIRGQAEAEAIRVYAEAHRKDPQFYQLSRSLEAYRKFLDEKTTVLLSADSELLKYLSGKGAFEQAAPEENKSSRSTP